MPQWMNTELIRYLRGVFIPLPANFAVRVFKSTDYTHASTGNWQTVDFDVESWDTGITNTYANGFFDSGVSATRFVATHAGFYIVNAHAWFAPDAVGVRGVSLWHSTLAVSIGSDTINAVDGLATRISTVSAPYWLDVGDRVVMQLYQSSGGNLNVSGPGGHGPEFGMVRIP